MGLCRWSTSRSTRYGGITKNEKFTKEILAFLKEKYGKENKKVYEEIAKTKQKGLFIREKYYNLPDEVADALLHQIKIDYKWIEENEDDDEEDKYRFDNILYIMRYASTQAGARSTSRGILSPRRRSNTRPRDTMIHRLMYTMTSLKRI